MISSERPGAQRARSTSERISAGRPDTTRGCRGEVLRIGTARRGRQPFPSIRVLLGLSSRSYERERSSRDFGESAPLLGTAAAYVGSRALHSPQVRALLSHLSSVGPRVQFLSHLRELRRAHRKRRADRRTEVRWVGSASLVASENATLAYGLSVRPRALCDVVPYTCDRALIADVVHLALVGGSRRR